MQKRDIIALVKKTIRKRLFSFKNAFRGIIYALKNHPNFFLQITIALAVLIFGLIFQLNQLEFALIFLAMVLVLSLELLNTALETLTDMLVLRFDQRAATIKDVAAGMVLVAAIGAAIIGILIFGSKFLLISNI